MRHELKNGPGRQMHDLHLDCIRDTVQKPYPNKGVTIRDGGKQNDTLIPRGDSDPNEIIF